MQDNNRADVLEAFRRYTEAFQALDPRAVARHFHEPAFFITPADVLSLPTVAAVEQTYARVMAGMPPDYARTEFSPLSEHRLSDDLAMVSGGGVWKNAANEEELADCAYDASTAEGTAGYQRKLQEMRYAITIEQEYSKEQILIGYLNLVNFGGSTYGIEAAAQYYFNTTAKDLTLNQAATLVGIVNNPNTLRLDYPDSETNGEENGYAAAKNRRDQVLGRMVRENKLPGYARYLQHRVALGRNDPAGALRHLRQAVALEPGNAEYREALSRLESAPAQP